MATKKKKEKMKNAGVEDLVLIAKISEETIVSNLKKRYFADLIYTAIGPVLISVNPFQRLPISGPEFIKMYQGTYRHELPPHIYALAEEAYRTMKNEGANQCCIISGESGAGKTEASKLIMGYIAAVSGSSEGVEYVKNVVLDSNPLLEGFGNAKTLRNNNSSRFGKYFEIHFNAYADPCGGLISNYLLEKSRVVYQTPGERCFHVFYNLLAGAGAEERDNFRLAAPDQYWYLSQSGTYTVDGIDDVADYAEIRKAMNTIGFSADEQWSILQVVAAILNLGNVSFVEDAKGNAQVADNYPLEMAAALFQTESFALSNALLTRVIVTGSAMGKQSIYNAPQNVEQATGAKNALSKSIYSRMFDFIVEKVNEALGKGQNPHKNVIGILDIFGFEIFERNGFEQFCINFVNEKLQQYFIDLTLRSEQEEYVQEGIQWTPIKYFNNQVVCDLLEGKKPPGVFLLLDDICATIHAQSGMATDLKFLQKCGGTIPSTNLHFRQLDTAFMVKHYAGEVTYEVEGFCDKNKDTLFEDLIETMQSSQNGFIAALFPERIEHGGQKKRPTTAGHKIKSSASELMAELKKCQPHYIRCIKPNDNKKPHDYDEQRVRHQVQYLGLLENVKVKRAGFAYRAPFDRFLKRYMKLSSKTWSMQGEWRGDPAEGCRVLLTDVQIPEDQWQLGKTKVFIRYPETLFHLEELDERRHYELTMRIQRAWKAWKLRKHALEQKAQIADLMRGKKERQRESVGRKFRADYIHYGDNFKMQDAIEKGESMLFADQGPKFNRRLTPERRDFVVTNKALYWLMRAQKKDTKELFYKIDHRVPLTTLDALSLSTFADNYLVFHVPGDYDTLMECSAKTEMAQVLREAVKQACNARELRINFTDSITWQIKTGDKRIVQFQRDESATTPKVKKAGKNLTISVASGLPKDTDTTPQNFRRGGIAGAGAALRPAVGVGAGAGAGAAAPPSYHQQHQLPQQQQQQQQQHHQPAQPVAAPQQPAAAFAAAAAQQQQQKALPQPTAGGAGARQLPQPGAGAGGARQLPQPGAGAGAGAARALPQPGGAAAASGRALPQPGAASGRALPKPGGAPMKPKAKPKPKPAPAKPAVKGLYTYAPGGEGELGFEEGDVMWLLQKDAGGWWEVAHQNGAGQGWVPANYVQEMP